MEEASAPLERPAAAAPHRKSIKAAYTPDLEAGRRTRFAGSLERQRNSREKLTHARRLAITIPDEAAPAITIPAAPLTPQSELLHSVAALNVESGASSSASPPPAPRPRAEGSFTWAERSVSPKDSARGK